MMIRSPLIRVLSSNPFMMKRTLSTEMAESFKHLKIVEHKPFVYNVQMNREKKMNALNKQMWWELGEAFKVLGQDPDCRVIVLSGNGKGFCAGIDLNDLMEMGNVVNDDEKDAARKAHFMLRVIKDFQNYFMEMEKCPKPVIAAIHGACIGGATNMITFADIRYCTEDAYFSVREAALGLCADVGALQRLPKLIGSQSLVRELCFTARKVDSQEANQCGLVSKVCHDKERFKRAAAQAAQRKVDEELLVILAGARVRPIAQKCANLMSASFELAEHIAAMSPVAIQGTKVNLNYARDHSVQEGLDFVAHWNMSMLQSEDLMKAAVAMISKDEEPPQFAKL